MKKIPNIYILIFPYLYILLVCIIFRDKNINEENLKTLAIVSIIVIAIYILNCIIVAISSAFKYEPKKAIKTSLLMKIVYIPIHLLLYVLIGAMANPFLVILIPVPFIISISLMSMTGMISAAGLINLYKHKIYKLGRTIVYILLSYCYIADLVISIITYIKVRGYNKDIDEVKEV